MRWFNLNTGIIILVIIIVLFAVGMGIIGFSLWNVEKAKELFTFLEISVEFPTKAIALFTGLATFGTLILALTTIVTIKSNNERDATRRADELSKERRQRDKSELDEIINWAVNIAQLDKLTEISAMMNIQNTEQERKYSSASLQKLKESITAILGKGLYTHYMASAYGEALYNAVYEASEVMVEHTKIIDRCRDAINNNNFTEFITCNEELKNHWSKLTQSATTVINIACDKKIDFLNI